MPSFMQPPCGFMQEAGAPEMSATSRLEYLSLTSSFLHFGPHTLNRQFNFFKTRQTNVPTIGSDQMRLWQVLNWHLLACSCCSEDIHVVVLQSRSILTCDTRRKRCAHGMFSG